MTKEDDSLGNDAKKEKMNMRETRRNGLSVVLVYVCIHCGCIHVSCVIRTLIG